MTNMQASPASGEARGLNSGNLVVVTKPTVMKILARFVEEVKSEKDFSPFLDRIMEDLDRPGQDDGAIVFDREAPAGERLFLCNSEGGPDE